VITTVLVIPLTVTLPPLQAMVRLSLMPETVMLSPAGAVEVGGVEGPVTDVEGIVPDGVGLSEGKLGTGNILGRPLRETWCAVKRKMPIGRAIMPMTKTAIAIQRIRPWERLGGLENESL
jgi:hypothetical protein